MAKMKNTTPKNQLSDGYTVGERTLLQQTWIQFKQNRLAIVGLIIISVMLLIVIGTTIVDIVTNYQFYDTYIIKQHLRNKLEPPSLKHPFGCDEFGRDLLFRVLWGTKKTLFIGIVAVIIALGTGGVLGVIAGFYGGRVDSVIMRFMDILLSVPTMILAIAVVTALGTGTFNLLLSLAAPRIARYARVSRASVMTVKEKEFIESARAVGASDPAIIMKYILPNALAPILVQASLGIGDSVLAVTGLSYLGLGVQPPQPEWGAIISSAKTYIRDAWHISVIPGIAIMITVLAFSLIGDGLRDALDPKLKK